ncbi:NAD-dependent epimerase/dehydratase family protein [Francisella orientalis]|uniref:UDP-glucose 4-epimerase n=1 Tax=Francisella orientalis TaxID=299583 RepID=A0AAP7KJ94_9GAMM|nr:NAD(P)-dependent oxidoreductase [Francisella orientalis]AFJ43995.1 NAD-dependent epimerase/dehydratase [Francisella orientalis str. Toba 04]AHB98593.1 epimerase [Francisella orientalis LADL 07-285A]AKN85835.1 NAD-dependent epimerase/dehydratase [Francisella orientalis FNO12]AKN87374.1 NAD-dependent epimerase/dehydratase [Francisella orientalis FNO24]AKN88911.1 NAD-dependent epimerase/dehydratase [Francisella orientalis]
MKKILITGAKGFLGSNISKFFKERGYQTYEIGDGSLSIKESQSIGLDYWQSGNISIKAILEFKQIFDIIIHCGGSGSVGFSIENPYQDFKKTVDGTLEVLEYMRVYNPKAQLIYPSSPAVQGEHTNTPIKEDYVGKPASPYGYHKKIVEDLCQSYSEKYSLKISVVRLFSVYGNGLKKQLLWDAYNKIRYSSKEVEFWGTGEETRDFIHIEDVLIIFLKLLNISEQFIILNGGTGLKYTVRQVVEIVKNLVNPKISIEFNRKVNIGNPIYYCADITKLKEICSSPSIKFEYDIVGYIDWVKKIND